MSKRTPGPWSLCGKGECKCMTIGSPNHPIARVSSGVWGDRYPSIRLTGGSLDTKAEAYMDMIKYGEINKEEAKANAEFIVKACNSHEALVEAWKSVRPIAYRGTRSIEECVTYAAAAETFAKAEEK